MFMRCETPCTCTNVLVEPWYQKAPFWILPPICNRKDEVMVFVAAVALFIVHWFRSKDPLHLFVNCKRYRPHGVGDDIAIITSHHNNFFIAYVTNDEMVDSMWPTWVQNPCEISLALGKSNDKLWFVLYGLIGKIGRINVDFVGIGYE